MDSTICRAHQHAAGASRHGDLQAEPPGGIQSEPADHALGRSRGGLSTKLLLACEQGQRLLALVVTAGQRGDAPQFTAVMAGIRVPRLGSGRPRTRPEIVRADKAYSSRAIRSHLRSRGIRCTIPEPADRVAARRRRGSRGGRPPAFDSVDYRARSAVECGIAQLKRHRGVATRFDELAVRYEATVLKAAINDWLTRLETGSRRITFVIGPDRRILGITHSETDMNAHAAWPRRSPTWACGCSPRWASPRTV